MTPSLRKLSAPDRGDAIDNTLDFPFQKTAERDLDTHAQCVVLFGAFTSRVRRRPSVVALVDDFDLACHRL